VANSNLHNAKSAKNDEFYTQWVDIEREMLAYHEYNQDVFRDKTILLPCDDPEWSNFTRFFASRFVEFGIKKLISTSYNRGGYGKLFVLDRELGDKDIDDLRVSQLAGDGDFRSDEVATLLNESDMAVTNPPFSLFREFWDWLFAANKDFIIIGNMNAITYKNVFPRIAANQAWLGASRKGDSHIYARTYITETGEQHTMGNSCWFTTIDHGRRHEPLPLLTKAEVIKHSFPKKKKTAEWSDFPKYDNYDAIEVPFTNMIPSDYEGVMGVPISFLDKYCPEQFEIVAFRKGDDGKDLVVSLSGGGTGTAVFPSSGQASQSPLMPNTTMDKESQHTSVSSLEKPYQNNFDTSVPGVLSAGAKEVSYGGGTTLTRELPSGTSGLFEWSKQELLPFCDRRATIFDGTVLYDRIAIRHIV